MYFNVFIPCQVIAVRLSRGEGLYLCRAWYIATCKLGRPDISMYTAVSRKVVGKSVRDNPERYCGWFCLPCSPKKFERMAREATDICSRVVMESNESGCDSYSR